MKTKKEIIELLNILRAKTDKEFSNSPDNDTGFHYESKQLTPGEKMTYRYQIGILKWILTDFQYDRFDQDKHKDDNYEDLK